MKRVAAAIVAALVLGIASPANGFHMETRPLWTWAPTTSEVTVIPVYAPINHKWGVDRAIIQWNEAGPVQLVRIDTPCRDCITIRVGRDPQEFKRPGQPTAIGLAYPTTVINGVMSQCDVAVSADLMRPRRYSAMTRRAVVAHELGHCLGLDHSDDMESIMNATVADYLDGPQPMDIDAIAEMYS